MHIWAHIVPSPSTLLGFGTSIKYATFSVCETPGSQHYLSVISALSHHYLSIIAALSQHYLIVISALSHRYLSIISALSQRYLSIISYNA
jgi:hypothetical protein